MKTRWVMFEDNKTNISHTKFFNMPVSVSLTTLTHMLNGMNNVTIIVLYCIVLYLLY